MVLKKWKRFAAIFTAGVIFLTGCGGSNGAGSSDENTTAADIQTVEESASSSKQEEDSANGEQPVLTIAMAQDGNVIDFDTNYLTTRLEEYGNVDLQLLALPADPSELKQKLSLMVSSGEALPDIVCVEGPLSFDDISMYGQMGVFIPLNEYLENAEKSPYLHENVPEEDLEYMLHSATSPDGNIYGVPIYGAEVGNECSYRAWINASWLETLGLDTPKTTEDFYNVLKAFKEQDPNGNGKADEIGMMGSANGWNQNPIPFLLNAFVYTDPAHDYLYVEDGKIVPAFTQEGWKEGLTYVNRLVSEDLLSPLSFTQDVNSFKTILENEDAQLMGSIAAGSLSVYTTESERLVDMDVLPPLTGPEGNCYAVYNPTVPMPQYFITKDCENPDVAFAIADYMFDKEMSMVQRWGEPGVDWDTNVEGLVSPYEESLGIEVGFREINKIWGTPQNSHWNGKIPTYRGMMDSWSIQGLGIEPDEAKGMTVMTPKAVPYYLDKHPEELITRLIYTEEELSELTTLKTDINTYVGESMTRFAVGEMPMTEWDSYLETLNSMGLERYLELVQAGYDRAKGNS